MSSTTKYLLAFICAQSVTIIVVFLLLSTKKPTSVSDSLFESKIDSLTSINSQLKDQDSLYLLKINQIINDLDKIDNVLNQIESDRRIIEYRYSVVRQSLPELSEDSLKKIALSP